MHVEQVFRGIGPVHYICICLGPVEYYGIVWFWVQLYFLPLPVPCLPFHIIVSKSSCYVFGKGLDLANSCKAVIISFTVSTSDSGVTTLRIARHEV